MSDLFSTKDLVTAVADVTGLTKKKTLEVLHVTFGAISNQLAKKVECQLYHFGRLKTLDMPERVGRNPQTGEKITIPASTRPHMVFSSVIKSRVKTGTEIDLTELLKVTEVEDEGDAQPTVPAIVPVKKVAKKVAKEGSPTAQTQPAATVPASKRKIGT